MSELQLEVSSEWTESEHMLGKGPPLDEINYVPWGTRSLKIHVSGDRKKGLVRVRPEPVRSSKLKYPNKANTTYKAGHA